MSEWQVDSYFIINASLSSLILVTFMALSFWRLRAFRAAVFRDRLYTSSCSSIPRAASVS